MSRQPRLRVPTYNGVIEHRTGDEMQRPGKWQVAFLISLVVVVALSLLAIWATSCGSSCENPRVGTSSAPTSTAR
ncbi:hypothetical protein TPB0596_04490 [Tsukamurella pulmonis]|nr:hypothetical protein TPB0596_04490 [Tsukamurella pulmonis]